MNREPDSYLGPLFDLEAHRQLDLVEAIDCATTEAGRPPLKTVPGPLGLHVTQYPNGRFGFVGRVPAELTIHAPASFDIAAAAWDFAASYGWAPCNKPSCACNA